jgi:DNA-binding transcriptional ArsR family regulator
LPIRFLLPATAVERVSHAYSPLLEAVLSLHVLVEPKHHPLQHPWVRRMRGLPPPLKRQVADFSFAYRRYVPTLFSPSPEQELGSFEDELAAFEALDPEIIALEFSRPLWDHEGRRDASHLERREVRAHIVRIARYLGADPDVASLVFEDPTELAKRFADLLRSYWEAGFAEEWDRVEPRLADTVSDAGRRIAADGVYDFLRGVSRQLRVEADREEFGIDVGHDHRVEITDARRLLLVPSVYAWPHVHVNCDEPWPPSVIYAAPYLSEASRPPLPSEELIGVLRALSDNTRLRALKLIAERPRSTQELAPLVGISDAGLSKHLRQLSDVGLVRSRREGYYVLYSLVPERIDPLSESLRRFLTGPG